ncbi:MAG TPA: hypothetical protein PLO64_02665 [Methanothermobacter sp.]|nr:conserved hypothetical protein [Methanothermobacter sp. MT-2]HHW05434.1 hypothetical protein [Methanothermobacter sp.]HOK73189.1 hypothetical protein [Methanothermobacter sp.]HOL68821.1 hypothetical protein [Methanothermobacter sp.]HPQ04714.1 hypothetical protein [Methanothermobacter sp.]
MIESKIKVLRQAAQVSTTSSDKIWCVAAGNEDTINNVAYEAIASKDKIKILFREHVSVKEAFVRKKFDLMMLYGDETKIRDLSIICKENGGAFLKIAPYYVKNEPNLLLLVAPENLIKRFIGEVEKKKTNLTLILEDKTTGFIEADVYLTARLPKFIRDIIDPLFKVTDVVLTTLLISVPMREDAEKIKEISTHNNIFIVDFKDILKED